MGSGGLKYEDLQAAETSNPVSMKSTTASLGGNGWTSFGIFSASRVTSSEMAGAGVASILEGGLLASALALEVGLESSSLDVEREWS